MNEHSGFTEQMPSTIGRYQVQGSIGFGAMGAVYKAFDPLIKRTLAIKTIRLDIPRQSPQYKSFIERFYHEARISGTLSHPNIVTLFDIGEEGGIPYLAMEFVEGETIASLLERGVRFPPEKVIGLVSQVAAAIDYAHGKGVIHRDIKPSNLILFEAERVKVTDFGIAKLVDAEMTQSGTLLGTPSYMSPEQAMGEKLDGRSDIFSLGVCAFEMLAGEQPFPGANVTSILYKLVHVDPIEPPNLEMNGLVPQKWHEVFNKVLAKRPDDRYQTASAFVQDLEYCLGSWFGAAVGDETVLESPLPALAAPEPTAPAAAAVAAPAAAKPIGEEVTAAISVVSLPPPAAAAAKVAPQPSAPSEDLPLTVQMKPATVETAGPTVRMASPAPLPPPPPPATATVKQAPPATVKHPVEPAMASRPGPPSPPPPKPAPSVWVRPAPSPTATTPFPAPPVTVRAASPPSRKGVPPALILGAAAVIFLLAIVIGVIAFLHGREAVGPAPAPIAEASAAPALPSATPAPAVAGVLLIDTQPSGATISVNGEGKGVAPLELGLPVGNYEVRAELKGYEPKAQIVNVSADTPRAEVRIALSRVAPATGSVEIVSTPAGGSVSIDGSPSGETPLAELKLKVGSHKIEIAMEGFEPWQGSVSVEAGKKARVEAPLKAVAKAASPSPKAEVVDTERVYQNTAAEVDTPARKISGSSAEYPKRAPSLRSGQSVSVSVSFVVSEKGEVEDVKVLESAGRIVDDAVVAAFRSWKYEPAVKQGQKVKVKVNWKQTFRVD
jgi:serine/threonine-protein kinase